MVYTLLALHTLSPPFTRLNQTTLFTLLDAAGLADALNNTAYTVFAPSDDACTCADVIGGDWWCIGVCGCRGVHVC